MKPLISFLWPCRFLSDSNIVGAEKVSVTKIPKEYLDSEWKELPSVFGGSRLVCIVTMNAFMDTLLLSYLV